MVASFFCETPDNISILWALDCRSCIHIFVSLQKISPNLMSSKQIGFIFMYSLVSPLFLLLAELNLLEEFGLGEWRDLRSKFHILAAIFCSGVTWNPFKFWILGHIESKRGMQAYKEFEMNLKCLKSCSNSQYSKQFTICRNAIVVWSQYSWIEWSFRRLY